MKTTHYLRTICLVALAMFCITAGSAIADTGVKAFKSEQVSSLNLQVASADTAVADQISVPSAWDAPYEVAHIQASTDFSRVAGTRTTVPKYGPCKHQHSYYYYTIDEPVASVQGRTVRVYKQVC